LLICHLVNVAVKVKAWPSRSWPRTCLRGQGQGLAFEAKDWPSRSRPRT